MRININNTLISTHQQDEQAKKTTYLPPVLLIIEPDEIASGSEQLQETDGFGMYS